MTTAPLDVPCPECDKPVGDHTIRGWQQCLEATGKNYTLPHADVPDGPLLTSGEQVMCGEITIKAGYLEGTALGVLPVLVFTFYSPGLEPMSNVPSPEYALVGTLEFFGQVRQLVNDTIDRLKKG